MPKRVKFAPRLTPSMLDRVKRDHNTFEAQAAVEIFTAYQIQQGLPVARDGDLYGVPFVPRSDSADASAARRMDVIKSYHDWLRDTRGTLPMLTVQAVILGDKSLRSIDAEMHQRKGTAKRHLVTGLRHFAALRGNVPRGARDWKLRPAETTSEAVISWADVLRWHSAITC